MWGLGGNDISLLSALVKCHYQGQELVAAGGMGEAESFEECRRCYVSCTRQGATTKAAAAKRNTQSYDFLS